MDREIPRQKEEIVNEMKKKAAIRKLIDGGLCENICAYGSNFYSRDAFGNLYGKLTKLYGKEPDRLNTLEEFWIPAMKKAVKYMVGASVEADIEEMTKMQMSCQFSHSMYRRSYRTQNFGYHAQSVIADVAYQILWPS